mmetsp:Transcript_14430/g.30687  ORF Transcript_14430/g.30687 Transcript_14430/m.30687 type:complete len:81 (+) Transcript_14430:2046-2288(+)
MNVVMHERTNERNERRRDSIYMYGMPCHAWRPSNNNNNNNTVTWDQSRLIGSTIANRSTVRYGTYVTCCTAHIQPRNKYK